MDPSSSDPSELSEEFGGLRRDLVLYRLLDWVSLVRRLTEWMLAVRRLLDWVSLVRRLLFRMLLVRRRLERVSLERWLMVEGGNVPL